MNRKMKSSELIQPVDDPLGWRTSRRQFLRSTALASAALVTPAVSVRAAGDKAPGKKLNVAGVRVGGMGHNNLKQCATENIVALCDVDENYAAISRSAIALGRRKHAGHEPQGGQCLRPPKVPEGLGAVGKFPDQFDGSCFGAKCVFHACSTRWSPRSGAQDESRVSAWGDNRYLQASVPANVANVVATAAGAWHSLALLENGSVAVWEGNPYNFFNETNVPAGLSNVVTVAASSFQHRPQNYDLTPHPLHIRVAAVLPGALVMPRALRRNRRPNREPTTPPMQRLCSVPVAQEFGAKVWRIRDWRIPSARGIMRATHLADE
jgi:hypothetical protein